MVKVLFLTLVDIISIENHGIYEDLLREFVKHGHEVFVITPSERRTGQKTRVYRQENVTIIKIRTGNVQKTNWIEKGISTILIELLFMWGIKKYLRNVKIDLVLYSTPPVTLVKPIEYIKNRDGAFSYLMLKDIFPQNAVDIGFMRAEGMIHRYFRVQEKKLYAVSDHIGCMSPANVEYVRKHNSEITEECVSVCANSIEPKFIKITDDEKKAIRERYNLPNDKLIFVYGGNLGKPQDVPFIIRCLDACKDKEDAFFLIVGSGTDYYLLAEYVRVERPKHVRISVSLQKKEYDKMIASCDVGLIFLDHRFTIPNFPSRLLSYMQVGLPTLACTDINTDIGEVIVNGGFGWWCESRKSEDFARVVDSIRANREELREMGKKAKKYLNEHYDAESVASQVLNSMIANNGQKERNVRVDKTEQDLIEDEV